MILISNLFYSADHGKIIKIVNAASADDSEKVNSVVIEELDVLSKSEPIRNLRVIRTMQYGEFKKILFFIIRSHVLLNRNVFWGKIKKTLLVR